ncbi:MAG: hypothetical protein ACTHNN_00910 [Xanthobacteraceae bacterium]
MGTRTDIVVVIMAGTAIVACIAAGMSAATAAGRTPGIAIIGKIANQHPVESLAAPTSADRNLQIIHRTLSRFPGQIDGLQCCVQEPPSLRPTAAFDFRRPRRKAARPTGLAG